MDCQTISQSGSCCKTFFAFKINGRFKMNTSLRRNCSQILLLGPDFTVQNEFLTIQKVAFTRDHDLRLKIRTSILMNCVDVRYHLAVVCKASINDPYKATTPSPSLGNYLEIRLNHGYAISDLRHCLHTETIKQCMVRCHLFVQ